LPGCVNVLARSVESGDDRSVVDASIEGEEIEIGFNVKFLIAALSAVGTPQVALKTTAAAQPGVIRPVGDEDYVHVIMPMHVH
jgi:DNA polymerase-3 subunit beta